MPSLPLKVGLLNLLLASAAWGAMVPVGATGPIVDLGYAAYRGSASTSTGENGPVAFFGGIPFAQAPLGDLRWRAPQMLNESMPAELVNVSNAQSYASPCIQQPAVAGVGSEGANPQSHALVLS